MIVAGTANKLCTIILSSMSLDNAVGRTIRKSIVILNRVHVVVIHSKKPPNGQEDKLPSLRLGKVLLNVGTL